MHNVYAALKRDLSKVMPAERLIDDPLRTLAYGTDASLYRLNPKLVVKVINEQEVKTLLTLANQYQTPVTFRAAGTSLSGQAVTDSVLAVLDGTAWQQHEISHDGKVIRLQPGVIGSQANNWLAPYGRKIGPDPASINAAKIGGIAANNASGMCCGTAQNSYNTLAGMRIIFADGTLLDTRDPNSIREFRVQKSAWLQQLYQLTEQVKADAELSRLIRHKYRLKNTTGYGLNALLDFDDPIDIVQHLMIGSEGTLGFISDISYQTVPDPVCKATALVIFPNIENACDSVSKLVAEKAPVTAVELMDRTALRSVEGKPGMPEWLAELDAEAAALLIDVRADQKGRLAQEVAAVSAVLAEAQLIQPLAFTSNPTEYAKLWNIRKGLFPSVGIVRQIGTTVIIEDVAFPIDQLAAGVRDLQRLFKKHHYDDALIFGHALAGNLHFVFTQEFSTDTEVKRYEAFMDDVCQMVAADYKGSLKAEHGTGRNMAPFVELEWGHAAYELMKAIKHLFDPDNLLNPGVILNDDQTVHIKNLKPLPVADDFIDRCIECGFCEPICPSRNLTLSPRQRITAWREMTRLETTGEDPKRLRDMRKAYNYQAIDTCAADGLCATRCPVSIDTSNLMKKLRTEQQGQLANFVADWVNNHFATVTRLTRFGLSAANTAHKVLGERNLQAIGDTTRWLSGNRLPSWQPLMPRSVKFTPLLQTGAYERKVVYFSACVCRVMGAAEGQDDPAVSTAVMSLLDKAGYEILYPEKVDGLCCGQPFASKGLPKQADSAVQKLEAALWAASEQGRYPIVCDTSPCTLRMRQQFTHDVQLFELTAFIHQHVLPYLTLREKRGTVSLHVTCSSRRMGLDKTMLALAEACAEKVIVPPEQSCCGFAGDKGFSQPELNASALQQLANTIPDECEGGYSNSRTCEIGLSLHSGVTYRSLAYLVDACYEQAEVGVSAQDSAQPKAVEKIV